MSPRIGLNSIILYESNDTICEWHNLSKANKKYRVPIYMNHDLVRPFFTDKIKKVCLRELVHSCYR